jgi:hypothetical protein
MIDFTAVSREIRSLVARRRGLLTFLGSVFAALGIFLQNALQGNLPPSLAGLQGRLFATYAFLLLVPTLVLALRLAKLHAGMTLNGVLYRRLMQHQGFMKKETDQGVRRAARVNVFGVGFLMFFLADVIAGLSAALLALALAAGPGLSAAVGALVVAAWLGLYFYFHGQAAAFALKKVQTDPCADFDREQWEAHQAGSLEDANQDMIGVLALVGLILFSAFEGLSGLGRAGEPGLDVPSEQVQAHGPTVYGLLMTVTCLLGMATYIRLRVAVGARSLEIDPTDRPFRPLKLTDSLLGYMLLAFLLAVSLHFLLYERLEFRLLLAVDAAVFVLAVLAEQVTLVVVGRGGRR